MSLPSRIGLLIWANAILAIGTALYFFICPGVTLLRWINDPGLRDGKIPRFTYSWHHALSQRLETWARRRLASGRAAGLNKFDVAGTEWPLFGTVFYLWATEALQENWHRGNAGFAPEPRRDAAGALAAAADLLVDPNHASWVRQRWGENYLHHQDLFFRMLLISGLTSYEKVTADSSHQVFLRDQVESLANELDASAYGLLEDYPGETYPVDIMAAIAAIRRADGVLGTDHTAFAARAVRAFQGERLDHATGLPAYFAESSSGQALGGARGIGISFMLLWAPELWPDMARQWYDSFARQYWQSGPMLAGFREFPIGFPKKDQFAFDVDAGPVILEFGTAASAFGLGAARANGRFDHAYSLGAEALIASWPLPNHTFLIPRLLSNLADAPYVGEEGILFNLTRGPIGAEFHPAGALPRIVFCGIAIYFLIGLACIASSLLRFVRLRKSRSSFRAVDFQFWAWLVFILSALALTLLGSWLAILPFLFALLLPRFAAPEKA